MELLALELLMSELVQGNILPCLFLHGLSKLFRRVCATISLRGFACDHLTFSLLQAIHIQGQHTDPFTRVFEDGYNLGYNRSPQ